MIRRRFLEFLLTIPFVGSLVSNGTQMVVIKNLSQRGPR